MAGGTTTTSRPRRRRPPPAGRRRGARRAAAVLAAAVAATAVWWSQRPGPPTTSACAVTGDGGTSFTLSPTQAQNASIIAAVAADKNMPDHAVTVALAAALQESKLVNLDHGDRDSLGLFQQRPSQGWGTPTEIMSPVYAAGAFFDKLALVPGWQTLPVGDAAQAVQASAAPRAYAPWTPEARALAAALTGETPAAFGCQLAGYAGLAPPAGSLDAAARSEFGSAPFGVPVDAKKGWAAASWAVAHAFEYHLRSVTFDGRTWAPSSEMWRAAPAATPVVTVQG